MAKSENQDVRDNKTTITPIGRICFPHLWEPFAFKAKQGEAQKEPQYSTILVFSDVIGAYNMDDMKRISKFAAFEKFGESTVKALIKKGKWAWPWRKGTDFEDEYGEPFTDDNAIFITPKSRNPPGIVDARAKAIMDQALLYAGCHARVSVYAHAYDTNGNKGVTFFLNNVQITRNNKKDTASVLAGARMDASDEFAPVSGADSGASEDDDDLF